MVNQQQARFEQMWRMRLFFTLADEETSDIDPTSPIGLYVISNYRPELRCTADYIKYDDIDRIQEWITAQFMGGT